MKKADAHSSDTGNQSQLVEPEWLQLHLSDPEMRIIDATVQVKLWPFPRIRSGRRKYRRNHIPGAVFADLLKISDPRAPGFTFTMPDKEHFANHMGQLGISNDCRVVIYDWRENMWATRLWWMLRYFGFENAVVLNGGWSAWTSTDRPVCSKTCSYPKAEFVPRINGDLIVSKEEVLEAIGDGETCIVSALGRRQHRGERNEYGRRGHIPGARNVTAWEILDRETNRYKPAVELRKLFGPMLDSPKVITYCGGGIAASSDAFILTMLGHKNVAVYDGGLIEWCKDRSLPLEMGS